MVQEPISRAISRHLKQIFDSNLNITYDYVALVSGVPKPTVYRAVKGQRMLRRTAHKLAEFIEIETKGKTSASFLLNAPTKNFHQADLKGADFSGEDLSELDFSGANLEDADFSGAKLENTNLAFANLRNANLKNTKGALTDLRCADLCGANIQDAHLIRWKMDRVKGDGLVLENCILDKVSLIGAEFQLTQVKQVVWNTLGYLTKHIEFPCINPVEIEGGNDCHIIGVIILLHEYPGDFNIRQFVEFAISRTYPCYSGVVRRLKNHWPYLIEPLFAAFRKYPKTRYYERLQLAFMMDACKDLGELEALQTHEYYQLFPYWIDKELRLAKQGKGEFVILPGGSLPERPFIS